MRLAFILLAPFAMASPIPAAQSCVELASIDHNKIFQEVGKRVNEAPTSNEIERLAAKWIELGSNRRDEALACMSKGASEPSNEFWNISYSYRVLSDTLSELLHIKGKMQVEVLRKEVLERIEFARENLVEQKP